MALASAAAPPHLWGGHSVFGAIEPFLEHKCEVNVLFHLLDAVLGTTSKVRVLRALIHLTSPVSGNEAQRLAGVRSSASVWSALDELTELAILSREQTRGSHLYRINREHDLYPSLAALFEAESGRVSRLREWLRRQLAEANQIDAIRSVILYGSNARADATARSDVDLLVITTSEEGVAASRDALLAGAPALERQTGLRISPYVLGQERVEERYRDGDPLMSTIAEEGRVLLGDPLREVAGAW
jgi:predicted nucleotidyltransferase